MTQSPNTLGRVLSYFTSAWRYAAPPAALDTSSKARRNVFAATLDLQAQADAYTRMEDSANVDESYRLAVTSYAVYSAIQQITNRITTKEARMRAVHVTDEETEQIKDHPFERLLRAPNTMMSGTFLLRYTAYWYLLRGNAYVFVGSPGVGAGEPLELWPLIASHVLPRPGTLRDGRGVFRGQKVIDFEYTINGVRQMLPGENVIHFRTPNPWSYWEGLSPLTAAIQSMEIDYSQGAWLRDFYDKRNAVPTAIISVPAETMDDEFDVIREKLKEEFESGQKSLVTRAGDLTVETIQHTLEQMQIYAGREINTKAIDRVYGIPEGLMSGALSGDSRHAVEVALARNTIQPLLDYMAEEWSAGIVPYYDDDQLVIESPNVIPEDRALKVKEYMAYAQDRTVNENRREQGLDKIDHWLAENAPVRMMPMMALEQKDAAEQQGAPGAPDQSGGAPEQAGPEGEPGGGGMPLGAPERVPPELANGAGDAAAKPLENPFRAEAEGELAEENAAKAVATRAELQRWRKVALRELRAGRRPEAREFASEVLPARLTRRIAKALARCEQADDVRAVFERVRVDLDLAEQRDATKHLPGMHDQREHGLWSEGVIPKDDPQAAEKPGAASPPAESGGPVDLEQAAKAAAAETLERVAQVEPAVTELLGGIAGQVGAKLEGLDYRLKSAESLARKIRADAGAKMIAPGEAAERISDALRYTLVADGKNYAGHVQATQAELERQGWVQYDHSWKNYWPSGDAYDGYNTVLVNRATGERFELQFHTPESLATKEKCHKFYERYRTLPAENVERVTLFRQMADLWQQTPKPANWQALPGTPISWTE